MFADLGPNTKQVRAFVSRCQRLSADERDEILREFPAAEAAYGQRKIDALELAAIKRYGFNCHEKILSALEQIASKSPRDENPKFALSAQGVTLAVAFCECLTPEQFAAWYGAFASAIPIESLPGGLAPIVHPPLSESWARFVCRLKSLEASEWGQALKVWELILDAVGEEAIDRAWDAVNAALQSTEQNSVLGAEIEAAATLIDEIDSLGEAYVQSLGGVYRGIGKFLRKDPGWISGAAVNWTEWISTFRHISGSATIALLVRDEISAQEFATIYAPFGGLIPPDSLYA